MNVRKILRQAYKELTASPIMPAVIVFLTMLVLIGSAWQAAKQDSIKTRNNLVEERAVLSETNVLQEVYSYENALLAGRGFILSSDEVDRREWESFVGALRLDERRRGMLGIGFAEFVEPQDLAAYERSVRAEGFETFKVWPNDSPRDLYSSITYIEPFDEINKSALGFDMYSEPIRREAMDRAIDSGQPEMTSKILLVQGGENRIPGLNLYQALYRKGAPIDTVEQRREAVVGFVYAPFIAKQLFGSVFQEADNEYNVRVYDGDSTDESKLLYEQHEGDGSYVAARTDTLEVAGVTWTFEFSIRDTIVPEAVRERPRSVLVGGILLAFVVATMVYLLLQRRMKSLKEKEERRVQRAKDNMLSLASHQLRTPATGVKQYVGMVLEGFTGELSPEQENMLRNAYESNERQLRIINEFLYLAKTEANRIVVTPQQIDLTKLVREIVTDMQSEIQEYGHDLTVKTKRKKGVCVADIHSTRMMIENLISNALKYTPSKGTIAITVGSGEKGCYVSVRDTGVGISQKDMPKLFQQFTRIPNELTKQTSGSGIGLYLAKQLAERNKGYIEVESVQGKGSTFTLYLTAENVKNFTEIDEK